MEFTVELLVANRYGALNRITSIYARRGYNIDELEAVVADKTNSDIYRITVRSKGDEYAKIQVMRQLEKLYDVKEVKLT
ncbi:MAG: acetolactate synthase small subunit [Oscillospiraceae bacterium]|nr:acetolactate synthase small subunit [Oscillospiraceae bacterium]